jgi:acyl-CoA-dependent ceramide synthase
MNVELAPTWLPRVLVPFFTLSYPSDRPVHPDSYLDSSYYGTGPLDGYFVLTWILVLGVLRECLRLGFLEPFARQYFHRKDLAKLKPQDEVARKAKTVANGKTNGHVLPSEGSLERPTISNQTKSKSSTYIVKQRPKEMSKEAWMRERSTVRFAEQGWQFAYYIVYWPLGMASLYMSVILEV